jgi:hypothetical protein
MVARRSQISRRKAQGGGWTGTTARIRDDIDAVAETMAQTTLVTMMRAAADVAPTDTMDGNRTTMTTVRIVVRTGETGTPSATAVQKKIEASRSGLDHCGRVHSIISFRIRVYRVHKTALRRRLARDRPRRAGVTSCSHTET